MGGKCKKERDSQAKIKVRIWENEKKEEKAERNMRKQKKAMGRETEFIYK